MSDSFQDYLNERKQSLTNLRLQSESETPLASPEVWRKEERKRKADKERRRSSFSSHSSLNEEFNKASRLLQKKSPTSPALSKRERKSLFKGSEEEEEEEEEEVRYLEEKREPFREDRYLYSDPYVEEADMEALLASLLG